MTDIEILRDVGISSFLYDNPSNSLLSMLIRAMAQARADEREKISRDALTKLMELPDVCKRVSDFVVKGK